MSSQSHYSLRWNNHQSHILAAFEALLQAETLVDVTLVCGERSVRAHKIVLGACSPLFQRILLENPCEHPVIVLHDFSGWEVQAIVDFMYKGEISVIQEQLQSLIKAAESLQVRGLVNQDTFTNPEKPPSLSTRTPTPSASPDYDTRYPRLSFPESLQPRAGSISPVQRRKQARPRRRSGDGAQDLTTAGARGASSEEEAAENLCMKQLRRDGEKEDAEPFSKRLRDQEEFNKGASPAPSGSPEMDLSMPGKEFRGSPITLPPPSIVKQEMNSHSPLPFPPMPSVSALSMAQPHTKFFGLDSPLGFFPPSMDGGRNPLFDMPDPRTTPDTQLFVKKKMGRPKGQHSAPRGGPPRSWTNAELTEALQQVWNKKMTTSQASRIFGIPYNSLLMYVRGKYGKSLKLEQLRKDCISGPAPPLDLMTMSNANNNNNNSCKGERDSEQIQPNTRPPSREENSQQQPLFNPFPPSFYPDFATGFPIPVNMIHLLPQSEKSRDHHSQQHSMDLEAIERLREIKEEPQDLYRPPPLSMDDRRELVQQNGQD